MSDPLDALDYYELLGVDPSASTDAIRHGFHTFALKYHPDRHSGEAADVDRRANQIYQRGAEAYRILLDPESRRSYDAGLQRGELRLTDSGVGTSRRPGGKSSLRPPQVRSSQARPFFQKAEKATAAGDYRQARLHLQIALGHEPDNAMLKERLAAVEDKLKQPS